jgi:nickel-dependent lactate racemase
MPGAAAARSILRNHSLTFHGTDCGKNPHADTASIEQNPVHLDMKEAAAIAGVDFCINVTMKDEHCVSGVFCGDVFKAHHEACRFFRRHYTTDLPMEFDLVIAGAGGSPKDGSLYQAHKAIDNAFRTVRRGGYIVMAAACPEGFGKEGFGEWLAMVSHVEIEKQLREEYHIEGHTAYCMRLKAEQAGIYLVTEMNAAQVRRSGLHHFRKIQKAVASAFVMLHKQGVDDPSVLFIKDATQILVP